MSEKKLRYKKLFQKGGIFPMDPPYIDAIKYRKNAVFSGRSPRYLSKDFETIISPRKEKFGVRDSEMFALQNGIEQKG